MLAVSLFACSQVAAARREEAEQRLETLLALPVEPRRWLGGRLALAVGGARCSRSPRACSPGWARPRRASHLSLPQMLEAGANCLPAALLFLGLAALAYAVAPRAGAGIAYGLVTVAFLWQLVGSLLGAPQVARRAHAVRARRRVPAQPFRAGAAAVMVAIGLAAAAAALPAFRRRDLTGA